MASSPEGQLNRQYATLDDSDAVDKIDQPKTVQQVRNSFSTYLANEYARLLGINKQGAPTQHCYIKGTEPVVIEEEVIIIRRHPHGGDGDE